MKINELPVYGRMMIEGFAVRHPAQNSLAIEVLIRMGVVDENKCKILIIRSFVDESVKSGCGKVDAMYMAADKFACSYEYVRNCMYYHREINFI